MKFEYQSYHQRASDAQLIEDLKSVARSLKLGSLSAKEYDEHGRFNSSTVSRRFGSWNKAVENAGLSSRNLFYSEEDLFQNLECAWIKKGTQPTRADMNDKRLSSISNGAYLRRFGRWSDALKAFVAHVNSDSVADNAKTISQQIIGRAEGRDVNLRLRFLVMKRDKFTCCMCGASPAKDPNVVLHVDHILPWSKGGRTVIENLQTLCDKCNLGKGNIVL